MARTLLVGALICLALALAVPAAAQDPARKYPIDIPAQGLTSALEQLANQTGVNWGFSPDTTEQEELQVGPVRGRYTVEEALTLLLRSTGLTFTRINSKNIAIVKAPPAPKVETPPAKPQPANRVGQAPQGADQADDDGYIYWIITTSSKLRHLPAPSAWGYEMPRAEIERAGVTSVMGLLNLLPQQPFLRPEGFRSNGAQYAELRALGPDTTMVLINGRRAPPSAGSFSVNAFDLNQVPVSAIERIEVQLDAISVQHGADAIGGVINIVLREEIAESTVDVRYGAAEGGGEQRQASFSTGLNGDHAHATLVLDYRDVSPLFGVERDLWRNQDYRRFNSSDLRSTISSPGNVFALPVMVPGIGAVQGLLPGLNAPFAAIPDQTIGPVTGLDEFRPFDLNRESLLQYAPIVAEDRRMSAVASVQVDIRPELTAAADFMIVDRRVAFPIVPPLYGEAVVPVSNPYNSFGVPVMVMGLLNGVAPTTFNLDSMLVRGSGSLRGKIDSWNWEASVLRSEEDAEIRFENVLDNDRLAVALASTDPDRQLNLLSPGLAASPDVLASLMRPQDIDTLAIDVTQLTAVADGMLFSLPAGEASLILGAEWRKESGQFDSLFGSFDREVAGGFAELELPLVSDSMNLPAVRELTFTAAGRFDRYTDFGDIFSPQFGLVWRPFAQVAVRATYGRSFRAPSLYDLYLPREEDPVPIADPRRGESYAPMLLSGGTRDLEATRGESFAAGVEFTPEAIAPLRLSATYWHVVMDDRITLLNHLFAVANESQVGGRVRRAEPTAQDVAMGLPGRIVQIDVTRMNFGRLTTSGIDAGANYVFATGVGQFTADLKGTWIDRYEALDLPGVPAVDRASLASSLGTVTRWRAIASLDWERDALGATAYVRYIPSYDDTREGVRNGRSIPSQTFVDLQFSVDVGELIEGSALLRGVEFTAGASNLFDQLPHFAEVNGIQGYDTSQGDLKGRFWYLRLGKSF